MSRLHADLWMAPTLVKLLGLYRREDYTYTAVELASFDYYKLPIDSEARNEAFGVSQKLLALVLKAVETIKTHRNAKEVQPAFPHSVVQLSKKSSSTPSVTGSMPTANSALMW